MLFCCIYFCYFALFILKWAEFLCFLCLNARAFGELKAVRLPKKLIGVEKHRGFAFVEYYTKSEAKVLTNKINACLLLLLNLNRCLTLLILFAESVSSLGTEHAFVWSKTGLGMGSDRGGRGRSQETNC